MTLFSVEWCVSVNFVEDYAFSYDCYMVSWSNIKSNEMLYHNSNSEFFDLLE